MTLSDFLGRIKVNKCNTHESIPISFHLQEVLHEKYYIHTRSGAQKVGINVGKVHGYDKPSLLHILEEQLKYYLRDLVVSYESTTLSHKYSHQKE